MPHFRFHGKRFRMGRESSDQKTPNPSLPKKNLRERDRLLLLLLLGLFFSVLFLVRMESDRWDMVKSRGQEALEQARVLAETTIEGGKRSAFIQKDPGMSSSIKSSAKAILSGRLPLPALWIFCSFTAAGAGVLYVSWIYLGFSLGILLWTVLASAGWQGPFTVWALAFPQYLCYIPALLLLYIGCLQWHRFVRRQNAHVQTSIRGPQMRLFLLRICLGILLYGAGIWAEIRWNPYILQ